MQIYGTKTWQVYAPTQPLPYSDEMVGKENPNLTVPQSTLDSPVLKDLKMAEGDFLYMPRGFIHEAECSAEPSLHLTLTVPSHDFTWAKFVTQAVENTLRSHLLSRHAVPVSVANGGVLDKASADKFKEVMDLVTHCTPEQAQGSFVAKMENHNQRQDHMMRPDNPMWDFKLTGHLRPANPMRMAPGMDMEVVNDQEEQPALLVKNGPRTLTLRINSEHVAIFEAVRQAQGMFRVGELPGDGFSQVCVCKLLIAKEVLQIGEPKEPSPDETTHETNEITNQVNLVALD
jgi:hypothetical protein